MNIKKIDFILLITFPILASIISLTLNVNFFYGTLLFFGVPSLYLSIRNKKVALKTFLFSLIFAAPLALISDYIASISGTWLIETSALLGFRFFGIVSPEGVIWGFFYIYFVIIFL